MAEPRFNDPKLAINKVYTKTGDKGKTSLVGGQRVLKNHGRIEAYGAVDELNACMGMVSVTIRSELAESQDREWFEAVLVRIQHELFNLGAVLATLPEDLHPLQPQVREQDIRQLERDIDRCNGELPVLRSFVLPGGSRTNAELHLCRTVCRRAERRLVALAASEPAPDFAIQYLNRLSDAFFVWSRWVNKLLGNAEVLWDPNQAGTKD